MARLRNFSHLPKSVWLLGYCRPAFLTLSSSHFDPKRLRISFDHVHESRERLLQRLQQGEGEANIYDAVFIDEAQDFSKTWFLCAKLALKEADDGDLLIVGDGSQSLYRRRNFTWKEAGVNAVGRTINTRFDLDKNYRNTQEILKLRTPQVRQ